MRIANTFLAVSTCTLFVVALAVFIQHAVEKNAEKEWHGECVATNPLVCTNGRISDSPGVFSSGPVQYHLWFKGKTQKSNEECKAKRRVTEAQFNKWMSP